MSNRSNTSLTISLHSALPENVALCAAVDLPAESGVPEWIHLLPAGQLSTVDGRGPYSVADATALALHSIQGGPLVLDENHATDLAAPKGEAAPAHGWITELQARGDGIWGKVDWTRRGRLMMSDKAYRHVSPVITHTPDGRVTAILRASLVNRPNLRGLTSLHQEQNMDFLKKLAASLGLPETATEEQIMAAVATAQQGTVALQSALDPIAAAAGVAAGSNAAAVLAGVQALTTRTGDAAVITALQSEIATLGNQLKTVTETTSREKATTFIDGEIVKGRVGVKPLRDHYISMHMADPARVEKEIGALPILSGATLEVTPPAADKDGNLPLTDAQRNAAALMGIEPKKYAETLKAEREAAL